ncbi:MAG TPA: hypothetical protein VMI11_07705 [Actinomycetes bacterium]|nr:hypothetical protein [Actinomycetes bacterium]
MDAAEQRRGPRTARRRRTAAISSRMTGLPSARRTGQGRRSSARAARSHIVLPLGMPEGGQAKATAAP